MIFLTPQLSPTNTLESFREVARSEGLNQDNVSEMVANFESILDSKPSRDANFYCKYALDQDGNPYWDVKVFYTARFTKDGVRWVSAGDIALNVDALFDMIKLAVEE